MNKYSRYLGVHMISSDNELLEMSSEYIPTTGLLVNSEDRLTFISVNGFLVYLICSSCFKFYYRYPKNHSKFNIEKNLFENKLTENSSRSRLNSHLEIYSFSWIMKDAIFEICSRYIVKSFVNRILEFRSNNFFSDDSKIWMSLDIFYGFYCL